MAPNRVLDDFARLMTDATEVAQGVRREAETAVKSQLDRLLATMDVVSREEFEAVQQMATMAREENEKLSKRVTALERVITAMGKGSAEEGERYVNRGRWFPAIEARLNPPNPIPDELQAPVP